MVGEDCRNYAIVEGAGFMPGYREILAFKAIPNLD